MNYLAHIHLADATQTSKLGNFLGDFVKGHSHQALPVHLGVGVRLHRLIDSYTDAHPAVRKLRQTFPRDLRRMAGISLDIYFDHLLLANWQHFNDQHAEILLQGFYAELEDFDVVLPGRYARVRNGLLTHRWLSDYADPEVCLTALESIETRLGKRVEFARKTFDFLILNKSPIEKCFLSFYPQLIGYAKRTSQTMDQPNQQRIER